MISWPPVLQISNTGEFLLMFRYILKRLLICIPVLIIVVLIIFWMLNVLPGNPIEQMMGEKLKPDVVARLTEKWGLNDPWIVRFGRYIRDVFLHGDFGDSYKKNRPVIDLIGESFPNTVKLAISSALVAWIIGIPAGIISAVKKNSFLDRFFMGIALCGISMPVFWAAMLLQFIFGYKLGILPISGYSSWKHMILPAIVLGWSSSGSIARLTRSNLLEAMRNDYIRTARAKGLNESGVIWKHALKNSMMPVVTTMAIQFAGLLSGATITETVFGIGGIGRLTVNALQTRDIPLLQGSIIFSTALIMVGNLVADIMYSFLDPRVRV